MRAVFALTAVCVGWLSLADARSSEAAGTVDPPSVSSDAFKGVTATRSVGPAFPILEYKPRERSTHAKQLGSQSLFFVETDAVTAMNSYAARAQDLGFMQPSSYTSAWCGNAPLALPGAPVAPGEARVVCVAHYERADHTSVEIDVTVCESCPEPLSAANVTVARYPRTTAPLLPDDLTPITSVAPDRPTLLLDERAWRSQRTPSNATLRQAGLPVFNGASPAMPVWDAGASGLCTIANAAVLEVTGEHPAEILGRYAHQTGDTRRRSVTTATIHGRAVTQLTGERSQLTLVDGNNLRNPWMLITQCTTD